MLRSVCFMRLHTAGVVVGYLGLAGSIFIAIASACALGFADVIAKAVEESMKQPDPKAHDEIHMMIVIFACIYLGSALISTMSSGMLIIGTMKNRHLMMLPWLVLNAIGLFSKIVYNLVLIYALYQAPMQFALIFVLSMLSLAFYAYIYAGIYSLFKHIQLSNDEQRPLVRSDNGTHDGTTYPNYTKI
ncbi:uncharacterized protein LOC132793392 [Drosophila nasuta]|uniref:Uncharacterized protein LOC117570404 n=1 Tax=Drosophila albomicans TaxID=7291 RepID=A0A6P8X3U4_DROAB|nr:uncharacterized protein LOC117570404 [Drosophila albomicans]XP_060659291.1 uncharacterized protein LOC132793392 [Drosophila nasuta]